MFENRAHHFKTLNSLLKDGESIDVHTAPFERAKNSYAAKCLDANPRIKDDGGYAIEFECMTADKYDAGFYDRDTALTKQEDNIFYVTFMDGDKPKGFLLDTEAEIHCIYIA